MGWVVGLDVGSKTIELETLDISGMVYGKIAERVA